MNKEEIRGLSRGLELVGQRELLEEWLRDQELSGQILEDLTVGSLGILAAFMTTNPVGYDIITDD